MPGPPDRVTAVPKLPSRQPDSHKGTYGRVLVVAGSRGMAGAAVLCGSAALRAGAGLVQVACPDGVQPTVTAGNPCYTTAGLAADPDGRLAQGGIDALDQLARRADAVAAGPGLGTGVAVRAAVGRLLAVSDKPLVLDADALNVLDDDLLPLVAERTAAAVLTPHPGEFARLLDVSTADVQADREELAARFARDYRVVLLLKGHGTVVTDGGRVYVGDTGNPGMATGGCGDVLTGVIAALVGQKLDGFAAAALGAWVHGRAGDLAAAELGEVSLTAADLLDYLPKAFREVAGS